MLKEKSGRTKRHKKKQMKNLKKLTEKEENDARRSIKLFSDICEN